LKHNAAYGAALNVGITVADKSLVPCSAGKRLVGFFRLA